MNCAKKLFVGGNWKCNNTLKESRTVIDKVLSKLKFDGDKVDVVVFPPTIHIQDTIANSSNKSILIGSQNINTRPFGAFTGETSYLHLSDFGVKWTLVGHSERRSIFGESDEEVASKTKFALENKFNVVVCVGESLTERESNLTLDVIDRQLQEVNKQIADKQLWKDIVIAYEPVWAIGTGKVASPEQAQEVHKWVRSWLSNLFGEEGSNATRIIYGGSVTDKNCKELIEQADIDGFLVGGASLKPAFVDIVGCVDKAAE